MDRIFNLDKLKDFKRDKANHIWVCTTEKTSVTLWCLEPNQTVMPHIHPESDDIWMFLEGEGEYLLEDGRTFKVKGGDVAVARPKELQGLRNSGRGRLVFVSVAGPRPVGIERRPQAKFQ